MKGMRVGLTGGLEGVSRTAFKEQLAEVGAEYVTRLDGDTDLLVVGDSPLSSKLEAAESLGVECIDWDTFQRRLEEPVPPSVPLALVSDDAQAPSLIRTEQTVRILDVQLPRTPPGPRTPTLEAFGDYTLDGPTLHVLRGLARAASLGHPCLLEGDTATSKTSAVRFLAALCGAEVVRLNLNGQTDTGELVGRYVPSDTGWSFAEGLVPRAMRHGWWVVLDEVNLAEPSVLERLNPVLERVPELMLTEGPGTRFGPGGEVAVHPSFRVFATMNPAEYTGRSVLSEAWRDRFTAQVVCRAAGELEFRQLLDHALTGTHPAVEIDGVRWSPAALPGAGRPTLGAVAGLADAWPRVASLFAGLVEMSTPSAGQAAPLGVRRRERYVFSRRGLLALLDTLERHRVFDPVSERMVGVEDRPMALLSDAVRGVTLDRMRDDEDHQRVAALLQSLGL